MAAYKGSVELISGITQKNGGSFPLMDAAAVQYDDTGKNVKQAIEELESASGNVEAITEEEIAALFTE